MPKDGCQLIARRLAPSGVPSPVLGVGETLYNTACSHIQETDGVHIICSTHPASNAICLTGHLYCPTVCRGRTAIPLRDYAGLISHRPGLGLLSEGSTAKNEPGWILQTQADFNPQWDTERVEWKHFLTSLSKPKGGSKVQAGRLFV